MNNLSLYIKINNEAQYLRKKIKNDGVFITGIIAGYKFRFFYNKNECHCCIKDRTAIAGLWPVFHSSKQVDTLLNS